MVELNNWCCEIVNKTFKLFQKGKIYDDTCERGCIFFYWEQIRLNKKACDNCQKLWKIEEERLEKDSKEEMEWPEKEQEKYKNCANCQGLINWKAEKGHVECKEYKEKNWGKQGTFGLSVCKAHKKAYCLTCEETVTYESDEQRAYCSKKCADELEDKEERQYWLSKFTEKELKDELQSRHE